MEEFLRILCIGLCTIVPIPVFTQAQLAQTRVGGHVGVSVGVAPGVVDIRVPSFADRLPQGAAVPVPVDTSRFSVVSKVELTGFASEATSNMNEQLSRDVQFFKNGVDKPVSDRGDIPFGPHLLTSQTAIEIGKMGSVFVQVSSGAARNLGLNASVAGSVVSKMRPPSLPPSTRCPFTEVTCDPLAKYRSFDGSCNNLAHSLWGRADTPFERDFPPMYGDGISTPRQMDISNINPLPLARKISAEFHGASGIWNEMADITHFSMEFGQFLSHDIQRNALSRGYLGSNLDCCNPRPIAVLSKEDSLSRRPATFLSGNREACFPIEIPANDPYFSQFNRTCMNFVRALPTPNLQCTLGPREQLNQNTHYIDGSQVYGSDSRTAESLRLFSGGKLKSSESGTLLPKDINNSAGCILPSINSVKCFRAGDVRVNQQPALISLHSIWMREHNRIAADLQARNTLWDDEKLYQEARKITGALLQHITYNEYLPDILGHQAMSQFHLYPMSSGYFNSYNPNMNAAIRNSFAAAGFRFGHSKVNDYVASRGATSSNHLFKDIFLKPDLIYDSNVGLTGITRGLIQTKSQKVDRLLTTQITQHMFERLPGTGLDLASINIQRGRDHGIASYVIWRLLCNLPAVTHFHSGVGGLVDHTPDMAGRLQSLYNSVYDIDLFTGGVSETPVTGGKLGPTFTCIVGKQFRRLKFGDRFFYESNNTNVKFSLDQLNAIRGESMAKIICRNTDITSVQSNVFRTGGVGNMPVNCNSLNAFDLSPWQSCIDGGWSVYGSWSQCMGGFRIRLRHCTNPKPNDCGLPCHGSPFDIQNCLSSIPGTISSSPVGLDALRKNLQTTLKRTRGSVNNILRNAVRMSSPSALSNPTNRRFRLQF